MKNSIKIVVNINGKDHSLSYEEAKKLYSELENIFGKRESIPYIPIEIPIEPYWDKNPIWPISPTSPIDPPWGPIYCNDSSDATKLPKPPKFITITHGCNLR